MLKNAMTFAGAALLLVFTAPYYMPLLNRTALEASPPAAPASHAVNMQMPVQPEPVALSDGYREKTLRADSRGQYSVEALVEGVSVPMLVDTGASYVLISSSAASRIGAHPTEGAQRVRFQTANGYSYATPVVLKTVDLGSIVMTDVEGFIADESAGEINLLGSSFLKRLASVEQRNGLLVLRQ